MSEMSDLSNKLKLSQLMDGEWHQLNPSECVVSLCADEALRGSWMRYHLIRDAIRSEPVQADQVLAARICDAIKGEPDYSNIRPFNGPDVQKSTHAKLERASTVQADDSSVIALDIGGPGMDGSDSSRSDGVERLTHVSDKASVQQIIRPADSSANKAAGKPVQNGKAKASWVNTGLAGFGLAASVALATVVGLNLFQQQTLDEVPALASNDEAGSANKIEAPASQGQIAAAGDDSVQADSVDNLVAQDDSANLPVVEFVSNEGAYWESLSSSKRVVDEDRLNMMLSLHIENSPTTSREGLLPYSRLVGYDEINTGR